MQRRQFIKQAGMGLGALCLSNILPCSGKPKSRPNILFLFADDQCHEALSAFGSEAQTPNLDRLAKRGVSFTNAYNQGAWNGAVCIASRTMLNTGRYLWHAEGLDQSLSREKEAGRIWSQYLQQSGYHTYFTGKWHIKIDPPEIFQTVKHVRPGMPKDHYDWTYSENIPEPGYDRPVEGEKDLWSPSDPKWGGFWEGGKHWSEVLGNDSVEYLDKASQEDKPFFMYLAFNAPHDPRQSPQEYVDRYPTDDIDIPESFQPLYPYRDKIGCGYQLRDARLAPFPRTKHAVKVHRQEYYAIISHMDYQVGRILDALEKTGKADNTWIFFTADHGLAVGQHGLFGKQNMFEHSVKAPLIVNGPSVPRGKRIETPVYIQDIMPTTLELAGRRIPDHVQFKSLLPLIEGSHAEHYDAIYGAYLDVQRMIRMGDFKLIVYPNVPVTLLFNLKNDPDEVNNLAEQEKYAPIIARLKARLKALQTEVGDSLEL